MANAIKFNSEKKPGVDDYFKSMFGTSQNDIQQIEIYKLIPFTGQPFKPYSEDKLQELADDIAEHGILSPLIVRPFDNSYQILAGHNRANAASLAGLSAVPCIVKNVDDDTAKIIMLNTNLNQREKLLPSEKAFAYKMRLEGMKRQGERTDLTSRPLGERLGSAEILGKEAGESARQIQRYIRLTALMPPLLDLVDSEAVPFRAGVFLSYCSENAQQRLLEFMAAHKIQSVSLDQAEQIKNLADVTIESLYGVFGIKEPGSSGTKATKAKTLTLKIPAELFGGKLPNVQADDELIRRIVDTIVQYSGETEH